MGTDLSPASEDFIQQIIATGVFQNRGQALEEAVRLLKRRYELIAHIEEGSQQLRSGDFSEIDDDGLRSYFDDVQSRGRERIAAINGDPYQDEMLEKIYKDRGRPMLEES